MIFYKLTKSRIARSKLRAGLLPLLAVQVSTITHRPRPPPRSLLGPQDAYQRPPDTSKQLQIPSRRFQPRSASPKNNIIFFE